MWVKTSPEGKSCYSPDCCHVHGCAPPKNRGFCGMTEWLGTGLLAADLVAPTPEPKAPDSPNTTLVCSVLPPLEHRVNGWANFVCWPYNRVPVPLVDSDFSLVDRNPTAFHSQVSRGHLFPAPMLSAVGTCLGFRLHSFQGESPTTDISLQDLSNPPWKLGQSFFHLHPSYQAWCDFFSKSLL